MIRNLLCFLIFFNIYTTAIFSAEWFPIGAKWHWTDYHCMRPECAYSTIEITKDTVVNGKIFRKGEVTHFSESFPYGRKRPEATILFENDNGKISYLFQGSTYRLYDFNLEVGDTMYTDMTLLSYYLSNVSGETDTVMTAKSVVKSAEYIEINNVPLKRYLLEPVHDIISTDTIYGAVHPGPFYATEKTGFDNTIGFFGTVYNSTFLTGGYYGKLRCYSDNEISWQKDEKIACDSLYIPYPHNTWFAKGATWYYETFYPVETHYGYLKMEVIKDTVIQNKIVSVIDREYISAWRSDDTLVHRAEPLYMYAAEGIVYQWINNEFFIIYEFFTVPKGKIPVRGNTYNGEMAYASIDKVWSIVLNGRKLNAFSVSDTVLVDGFNGCVTVDAPAIFEKIGSVYNFFPVVAPCHAVDWVPEAQNLRCYYDYETGWLTAEDLQSPAHLYYLSCDTIIPFVRVGTQAKTFDKINIYPNPAEGILNVSISDATSLTKAEIFSLDGRIVLTIHHFNSGKIDVSRLEKGAYILLATSKDGKQYYAKFTKNN